MNNGSLNEIFQVAAGYRNISLPPPTEPWHKTYNLLPWIPSQHCELTHETKTRNCARNSLDKPSDHMAYVREKGALWGGRLTAKKKITKHFMQNNRIFHYHYRISMFRKNEYRLLNNSQFYLRFIIFKFHILLLFGKKTLFRSQKLRKFPKKIHFY